MRTMAVIAARRRVTATHRALASFLALSLAFSQFRVSARATGHHCAGTRATTTAAVITAATQAGAGCTHTVGCGPTVCCTAVLPALLQAGVVQTDWAGLASLIPAANTRVPRLLLGGPPTPPPNS